MRTTQQLSITLPKEMAKLLREKVTSGQYASESEVIRDGLRVLVARDRALEQWLKEKVVPAYDAMKENPGQGLSIAKVRANLARLRKKASKAR